MKSYTQWQQPLLKNIQLQLFVSFISLPFLIGWGLPISLVTPFSTLIFGPFLTLFLLISSLIFFLELLYLPNSLFIWLLERITTVWLMCLNLEQKTWLIGFSKPSMIILLLIPCIALIIMHSKKIPTISLRTAILALFLFATCVTLKCFSHRTANFITQIPCNKGEITIIHHHNTIILVDPAYLAARPSYESYISYTLIPEIIQSTGSMHVDHIIIGKLNKRILDAIQFLATKITIKNLYLPAWKGKIPLWAWRSYIHLKQTIAHNGGEIISISYPKKLNLYDSCKLLIEPTEKTTLYYDAAYKALNIQGIIYNQPFSL